MSDRLAQFAGLEHAQVAACAGLVERGDPDRFLATMAAPPAARAPLFVLQAFNLEVARAPWVTKEALLARMRLQFWHDVVEGAGIEPAPAHEVAGPLAVLIAGRGLPKGPLLAMIAAREVDLERVPFADSAALWQYLEATSGGLMQLCIRALGDTADDVTDDMADDMARDLGAAQGLANYLLAVPALEAAGRLPLPDGRVEAVAQLAQEGLKRLSSARAAGGQVAAAARPALLAAWRVHALLTQAVHAPERVASGALGQSEFARRGSLLWRSLTGF